MIVERVSRPDGTVSFDGEGFHLVKLHDEAPQCHDHGCVIHSPTPDCEANRAGWPYNWRTDRGIMERICPHGVGHPDPDAAAYLARRGIDFENVHGCCGCPCGKGHP